MALTSETKVGLFTLAGLSLFAAGILMLGDVQFRGHYALYVYFSDVSGLPEKGPVKVAGVEIGKVESVALEGARARVKIRVRDDVAVHRGARAKVASTGLIGTKFLDLTLGDAAAPVVRPGDTIDGETTLSFDQVMTKLGDFLKDDPESGAVADNLKATLANFRKLSETLARSLGEQRTELTEIVQNIRDMSAHAKRVAADLADITTARKEDVKVALEKFRSISERLDDLTARVQSGQGLLGKLVTDEKMGDELKQTLSSVKQATKDLESFTGRVSRIEVFWDYRQRYDFEEEKSRPDLGLRWVPRPGKFYAIAGNNLGSREDRKSDPEADLERKNTITAVMGQDFGPFTFYAGALRSAGGVGARWRPLPKSSGWNRRVELEAEAYNFGRDEVVRGVVMDKPVYNAGLRVNAVAPWVWIGGGVEDMAARKNFNANVNILFKDEDIAFLLGLVNIAR